MMILIGLQYDNDHYDNDHDEYDIDHNEHDINHDSDTDAPSVLLETMSRWWPWWWEGDTQDITS